MTESARGDDTRLDGPVQLRSNRLPRPAGSGRAPLPAR